MKREIKEQIKWPKKKKRNDILVHISLYIGTPTQEKKSKIKGTIRTF